jgi:Short C-terminal domain
VELETVIAFLKRAQVRDLALGLIGVLAFTAPAAHAGLFDSLFGSGKAQAQPVTKAAPGALKRRSWRLSEFSEVRLVPSEPGSEANAHPATFTLEELRKMLAGVRTSVTGSDQALFATSELDELVGALHEALLAAGPKDDVLLLSSDRRGGSILVAPTAVTARLFVQGSLLNLVVNDSRFDFFYKYRGTGRPPEFTFGSRALPSTQAVLQRPGAVVRRPDWLEIPLKAGDAVAESTAAAPGQTLGAQPTSPPLAPSAVATENADEFERRLGTLKRLRDKGLITEDEYQEKRKAVMQRL